MWKEFWHQIKTQTLKTNWRHPFVQSSRNFPHSRSAMSKLNIFLSSWHNIINHNNHCDELIFLNLITKKKLNGELMAWRELITGSISSWRFLRFSSTNSYSLVLAWKYLFKEKVSTSNKFTWRNGEQPGSGASSEQPCNCVCIWSQHMSDEMRS